MIYDFALEPELVATWHDPRVASPILLQMGVGTSRVPCSFPSPAWKKMVMDRFLAGEKGDDQMAKKRMEALLSRLQEIGTRRKGKRSENPWLDTALEEHQEFPFGGILVRASTATALVVVTEEQALEETPFLTKAPPPTTWHPLAPPVERTPQALARAMAPLLRSATKIRFVDPYFDASDPTYLEPMKHYLAVAQNRRTPPELSFEIHFSVSSARGGEADQRARLQSRPLTRLDVAQQKLDDCANCLEPLLKEHVKMKAFAWGEAKAGGFRMHNRYVLTEIGGIAVQTGLDQGRSGQTDDLTLLSKEQLQQRWKEFCDEATLYESLGTREIA